MRNMVKCSLALGLASFVLVSCGKKDEDPTTATPTALEGTWASCEADGTDGDYKADTFKFTGNAFERVFGMYSDATCATKLFEIKVTGTFAIGAASTVSGATNADFTVSTGTAVVASDSFVTMFNTGVMFEYNDWVKDTAKSVLGKKMSTSDTEAFPAQGGVMPDIFKIDGTKLYLGVEADGVYSVRPTALDTGYLTKK